MHMPDCLISPEVGGAMMIFSAGVAAYSIKKIRDEGDVGKAPMMGVMGAFVFACQMINFSIPGTGSSGHLGGGMLLAAMLGPYAGFLTMACILLAQALFFGDGGLLAYGCNVFNLGFYTCFIAFPLIYKRITRKGLTLGRIFSASMLSSIIGLQMGAFSVVLQTMLSGRTELPFGEFVMLMQPIHLAIGVVEGLVTAAVISLVRRSHPELLRPVTTRPIGGFSTQKALARFLGAAVIIGGIISLFASSNPDGLEWAIQRVSDAQLQVSGAVYALFENIQSKTAFLPDYGFNTANLNEAYGFMATGISGIAGGALTLILSGLTGFIILKKEKRLSAFI
ncbi:MAG: energy-coupling factor ABC transporter permease [Christensenellales bacterium]|jgi:cobalt/nickel transport system permease protein